MSERRVLCFLALFALTACGSGVGNQQVGQTPSAAVSPAAVTPSTGTGATPSPPPMRIALSLACRMPVISATTGSEPPGGWVTFPGGSFVRDPASKFPNKFFEGQLPSYDRAIGGWVPVGAESVAPDGASYVLHFDVSLENPNAFYLVDAKSGTRRLLHLDAGPAGSTWRVVQYASEGIYLWTGNAGMAPTAPGLWLLDPQTGSVRLVDGSHYWSMVSGGAAWALDEAGTRASASKVYRLDLVTGTVSTLYESKTNIALLSPTPDGEMLIDYGEIGSPRLALLAEPGSFVPIELPPGPFPPVFSAHLASQGVWLAVYGSAWSGVALYVKGEGVTVMAVSAYALQPAGACL